MISIALQQSIQTNLFRFGGPILVIIGSVSCILSFIVFTKKNLRKSPCAMYFTALSITDFLYIYVSLFTTLLFGYNINLTSYNDIFSRVSFYLSYLLDSSSPTYLVLASIDRILITSSNARTRRYSTRRLAVICIFCSSLFWGVFHLHTLIWAGIQQFGPNYFACYFQSGIYAIFLGYFAVIKAALIPLILIICGLWTMKNIRSLHQIRVAPISMATRSTAATNQQSTSPKDRQLVLMLLIDIVIYILFEVFIAAVLMEQQITQYQTKDYEQIQFENFLRNIGIFCLNIPFCVGLYTKLLVSKTFRSEVKNVFTTIRDFCMRRLHGA